MWRNEDRGRLYRKLLAKKLSYFQNEIKLQAKHEIDNIMFKYLTQMIRHNQQQQQFQQLQQLQQGSNRWNQVSDLTNKQNNYPTEIPAFQSIL